MRSIQIVAPDHSGMAMDVDVIRSALRGSECEVSWGQPPALSRTQKLVRKTRLLDRRRHRFRLNVLIQAPFKWSLPDAEVNCLIPNQEWFSVEDVPQLRHVQEVWCKSEAAVDVFRDLGCTTRYIGFSSHDLYDPELGERRDRFDRCLHVNGSSAWKGTQVLLDTWLMHPEWPHLTVVTRVPVRRPSSQQGGASPGSVPPTVVSLRKLSTKPNSAAASSGAPAVKRSAKPTAQTRQNPREPNLSTTRVVRCLTKTGSRFLGIPGTSIQIQTGNST